MRLARLFAFPLIAALAAGCASAPGGSYYTGVGSAQIVPGKSFKEGRLAAIHLAERNARDQILAQAANEKMANGAYLGHAMIADPVVRAKVYDTVRTAQIAEEKVDPAGAVSVTLRLESRLVQEILADPGFAATLSK